MNIKEASTEDKKRWNQFIEKHYPPVGAFMHTWEWGDFQKALGRKIERYFVKDANQILAAFYIVHHELPMGISYGYIPRGPVFGVPHSNHEKIFEIMHHIREWAKETFPKHSFIRLEPPIDSDVPKSLRKKFHFPKHYVQPRFNHFINIEKSDEEIAHSFHPSTRSNLTRAERRGVTVETRVEFTKTDKEHFSGMIRDTIQRNSGTNAYPSDYYFNSLMKAIPLLKEEHTKDDLSFGIFYGYQDGSLAAINFVLFFGNTATYLYGASYTAHLKSKVTTYLHWAAMKEAKKRGLKYYDLGGIDEKRWPNLTTFKRQFKGEESNYVGNIDISINPITHRIFNFLQKLKSK